jgi:hypothetical protein
MYEYQHKHLHAFYINASARTPLKTKTARTIHDTGVDPLEDVASH